MGALLAAAGMWGTAWVHCWLLLAIKYKACCCVPKKIFCLACGCLAAAGDKIQGMLLRVWLGWAALVHGWAAWLHRPTTDAN
jgi:hypothetical protein